MQLYASEDAGYEPLPVGQREDRSGRLWIRYSDGHVTCGVPFINDANELDYDFQTVPNVYVYGYRQLIELAGDTTKNYHDFMEKRAEREARREAARKLSRAKV